MKIIERPILHGQENEFFSPIRTKVHYLRLITISARQLLLPMNHRGVQTQGYFRLKVDKMSRLFFYDRTKCFSVSFPFSVVIDGDNVLSISTREGESIDSRAIAGILSILDSSDFRQASFIDYYMNQDTEDSPNFHDDFTLVEKLFHFESGYIRYDCDPQNENGNLHPLHHLDINYSQAGTYKLGLTKKMEQEIFEDLQNIKTDCIFLKD